MIRDPLPYSSVYWAKYSPVRIPKGDCLAGRIRGIQTRIKGRLQGLLGQFIRCAAKLEAPGIPMGEKAIADRSIRALRHPEGKFPIVLKAL